MYIYSQIPTLCDMQFVPETVTLPAKYHHYPIDKEWYLQNIRDYETVRRPYRQPVQQSDKKYLECHVANIDGVQGMDTSYTIIDCDGNTVVTAQNPSFIIYDANSVYVNEAGVSVPMAVNKWYFTFAQHGLDDGIYTIVVRVNFYEDGNPTPVETRLWLSEPQDVKEDHPDTVYIEAKHKDNSKGVIFNYDTSDNSGYTGTFFYSPLFGYRVYGDFDRSPRVKRGSTDMIEQDNDTRNIETKTSTTARLKIGGDSGVPFYEIDKINNALALSHKYIDGRRKSVVESAEFEMTEFENYPLYEAEIEITDYDGRDRYSDIRGDTIQLFEIPSYPFFVRSVFLTVVGNVINPNGYHITNNTTRDALVTALNTVSAPALGLTGTFAVDSGYLVYNNASTESYELAFQQVLTEYFSLTATTSAINQTFRIYYDKATAGIAWGDGGVNNLFNNVSADNYISHTYAASGTYTIYFFHNDGASALGRMGRLKIDGSQMTGQMTGTIGGNLPLTVNEINIRNNPNLGTAHALSLSFLARLKSVAKTVILNNNGLTSLTGNVFADNPYTPSNLYWTALYVLEVKEALSVSEVNEFVNGFYDNTMVTMLTYLGIQQTPPATPTGSALTKCNTMSTIYGIIVIRD